MFEIRTQSPLDDYWEERDKQIEAAAGRHSDGSGASCDSRRRHSERSHIWIVPAFAEAVEMKQRLQTVDSVQVFLREH